MLLKCSLWCVLYEVLFPFLWLRHKLLAKEWFQLKVHLFFSTTKTGYHAMFSYV